MALKDPKMSKQGTNGKRKNKTLKIHQKLEKNGVLKRVQAEETLWIHTTLDCQYSMI
jgi:hypothetical protein